MIKLIALDLDGTLLTSEKKISEGNIKALQKANEAGVEIVLATGRTLTGIKTILDELPFVRYAIMANGAVLQNVRTTEVMDACLLPVRKVLELVDMVEGQDIMYDVLTDGNAYADSKHFPQFLLDTGVTDYLISVMLQTRQAKDNLRGYIESCNKPIEKMNLSFHDMELRQKTREKLEEDKSLIVTSSLGINLEINAAGATKGDGLIRLGRILGMTSDELMAMGDGDNDVSMLAQAGCGVAMANAMPKAKAAARYLTTSNDEDGVAAAVYKYVLI